MQTLQNRWEAAELTHAFNAHVDMRSVRHNPIASHPFIQAGNNGSQ